VFELKIETLQEYILYYHPFLNEEAPVWLWLSWHLLAIYLLAKAFGFHRFRKKIHFIVALTIPLFLVFVLPFVLLLYLLTWVSLEVVGVIFFPESWISKLFVIFIITAILVSILWACRARVYDFFEFFIEETFSLEIPWDLHEAVNYLLGRTSYPWDYAQDVHRSRQPRWWNWIYEKSRFAKIMQEMYENNKKDSGNIYGILLLILLCSISASYYPNPDVPDDTYRFAGGICIFISIFLFFYYEGLFKNLFFDTYASYKKLKREIAFLRENQNAYLLFKNPHSEDGLMITFALNGLDIGLGFYALSPKPGNVWFHLSEGMTFRHMVSFFGGTYSDGISDDILIKDSYTQKYYLDKFQRFHRR